MPPNANARRALAPLDMTSVAEWLVERGLRGLPLDDQVDGFCRRVVDAGFPARRFNMSIGTLHPRHGARSYVWRPGGLETEEFARQRSGEEREPYLRSPIHHLQTSGEISLRRRLDPGTPDDFPVLADLREAGMTDYAARIVPFDGGQTATLRAGAGVISEGVDQPNPMQGIFFSCTTDVQGGFDDGQLRQVGDLLPYLALAVKSRSMFEVARTLLATYRCADGRGTTSGDLAAVQRRAPRHRQADAGLWCRTPFRRSALRQYRFERAARFHRRGFGGKRGEPYRRAVPAPPAQSTRIEHVF